MYSSYKEQAYTFEDHNVFNFGISNLNESALHFCDSAVSDEKSNTKLFTFSQNTDVLTSNPSNSTALGSRDNEIETPQLCHTPSDWEKDIYEFLTVSESSQPKVDIGFSQEYMPVKSERTAVYDAHVLSTTVSTSSPVETGDDTPKSESSEGSEYNVNGHSMEVETVTKTKPDQSKYKNKLKELFEKALKMYNEIKTMTYEEFVKIMGENAKSDEEWAFEGANLEGSLRMFEMMTCNGNKKEAAKIKKTILRELEAKQYCCIAELYNFKAEILELESDVIQNFNKNYKSKVSHAFFKKSEFDSEDLFSWMLLAQIALALIPEDQEYVELLPLKKSTVCLGTWLLDSPMKQENKDLYKDSTVRNHLREVMTEVYSNLMSQATYKMDQGRLVLLQRVSEALGTNFAPMQRSPRRVVRAARARASPQYDEIECDMTGKRGSNRAPVLSENKTTKKVNKQRK